jgi:hypothetical protein
MFVAEGVRAAWGTSFEIGKHIYTMKVEEIELSAYGLEYFYAELMTPLPDDGVGFLIKFDNMENELMVGDAHRRLPADKRLSIKEFLHLEKLLVGGVMSYMTDYAVPMLIGVPNDSKLERWYHRLMARVDQPGFRVGMRRTYFHPHGVALICRR